MRDGGGERVVEFARVGHTDAVPAAQLRVLGKVGVVQRGLPHLPVAGSRDRGPSATNANRVAPRNVSSVHSDREREDRVVYEALKNAYFESLSQSQER